MELCCGNARFCVGHSLGQQKYGVAEGADDTGVVLGRSAAAKDVKTEPDRRFRGGDC